MRFSQRKGIRPIRVEIQRDVVDQPLRNKIWSALALTAFQNRSRSHVSDYPLPKLVIKRLWIYFFEEPVDGAPANWPQFIDHVRTLILMEWEWFEVYDFLEQLASEIERVNTSLLEQYTDMVNNFLESEMSAYRLIGGEIAEITNSQEISAIEGALTDTSLLAPVHTHFREALAKLTDRQNPDYRNSIKESISAVEALCRLITGDSKATLGQALKRLDNAGVPIHAALKDAWLKIYGYTSDQGGIRHALSADQDPDFGAAKYMLVSCTAFVSYLILLADESGISLGSAPTQQS